MMPWIKARDVQFNFSTSLANPVMCNVAPLLLDGFKRCTFLSNSCIISPSSMLCRLNKREKSFFIFRGSDTEYADCEMTVPSH